MRSHPLPTSLLAVLPALLAATCGAQQPRPLQGRTPGLQVVEPDEQEQQLRVTPVVRAVRKAQDSVVSIYLSQMLAGGRVYPEGQGSGVILDDSGFVITNWHVIASALADSNTTVEVKLRDGRSRRARVLSTSPEHDLALLQMQLEPGERVAPIEIGRSSDLMIGEDVIAIGNPQGHANTVTHGVLSATGRSIRVSAPDRVVREYTGLLQTDAAINRGNSGGALLDITGRLIGINNAMAMGAENIGFAIPVDTVRDVFENELVSSSSFVAAADTAWLGMTVAERQGALRVVDLVPSGPAAQAGIQTGDTVIAVADAPARTRLDFARRLLTAAPDQPLTVRVRRGERELDIATRPLPRPVGVILAHTGLLVEEISASADRELAEQVTRAFYAGSGMWRLPLFPAVLRVRSVEAGSPAAALQVEPGDVLLALVLETRYGRPRDVRLDSSLELAQLLQRAQGSTVRLVVLRDGEDLVGTLDVRRLDDQR